MASKGSPFPSWTNQLCISNGAAIEALTLYRDFSKKTLGYFDASPAAAFGFNNNQVKAAADVLQRIRRRTKGWWGHVTGAMDSGKSAVLVLVAEALKKEGRQMKAFCHANDLARTQKQQKILSHGNQRGIAAQAYNDILTIKKTLDGVDPGTVFLVDELQFAGGVTVATMEGLRTMFKQRRVCVLSAGLDMTFTRTPWENTVPVFHAAEELFVLAARCRGNGIACGLPGIYSQRLVDGVPASRSDPIVLVGKDQLYHAACPVHHKIRV